MCASAYGGEVGDNAYLAYRPLICYTSCMAKTKTETATAAIRIYPSTRRKLNIKAAQRGLTLAEMVEMVTSEHQKVS